MGNEVSSEEKQEKNILHAPNVGQASDLYWASRAGDVDAVRQILATTSFNDLNRLEPNGSTALHAASFFGHADVVRLLLQERGIMRHRKNRHGLTAYEEAANDEIRQLFHRPNSNRFYNDSADDNENIFDIAADQLPNDDEDDDERYNDWVARNENELQVRVARSGIQIRKWATSSSLVQLLAKKLVQDGDFIGDTSVTDLQELIDKHVTSTHPEYDKACELLSKYAKTKKPEYLLRLYSLETPFYQHLGIGQNKECLLFLLLHKLNSLKTRTFHGRTYRGLSMTATDFRAYRWALRKKGSIILPKSFCSTSVEENVARRFMPTSSSEKLNVLMIFDFPQPCDTAIQLYALSDTLPCISDFENEREVLVLPYTMFHVVNIMKEDLSGEYTIHLENILPKLDLMALISAYRNGSLQDANIV